MPEFEYVTRLNCSAEGLFEFMTRPHNLLRLAMPENRLTFVEAPAEIIAGSELEFEVRAFGQTQSATHVILELERPRRFLEQMLHGPLEEFQQEHLFSQHGDTAVMADRITFEPPRGLLGLLLTPSRLRDTFERNLAYQQQRLEELVAQGEIR